MAQTGYTPILIYSSSTTTNAPAVGNLTNSTLGSELAINITDGKLFYKDNANAIQVIGWKTTPTTAGGTGLTSYTAGDLLYYATGTTLAKLAIGASTTVLTSSGSAPQWTAQSALSVGTAANLLSNASTGVMQITGPGTGTTRVMTIPNANFTAARTDAGQTFTGNQVISAGTLDVSSASAGVTIGDLYVDTPNKIVYVGRQSSTGGDASSFIVRGRQGTVAFQVDPGNPSITASCDLTISGANLVIGTSGKGIDFSATPGTGTSELFNDYEEGTFTPAVYSGVTSPTYTEQVGRYTKIGIFVFLEIRITFSGGTGSGAQIGINGFPYSSANAKPNGAGYTAYCDATATGITWYMPEAINTNILGFFAGGTNAILAGALAGKAIILNVTYQSY
jgi:hypothetical protein